MMLKRTLYSLLLVSFIAVFASMSYAADGVTVSDQPGLKRCIAWQTNITADVDATQGAVSAIEVVLDVTKLSGIPGTCPNGIENIGITWNAGFSQLSVREVDLSDLPLIRIAAMMAGPLADSLGAGSHVIAAITFMTDECCAAEVEIDEAIWPSQEPFETIQTQFVDASTGVLRVIQDVTSGTITVTNVAPVFTDVALNVTMGFNDANYTYQFESTDGDAVCETKTFFAQGALPGFMTLTPAGLLTVDPTAANICFDGNIVVGVKDKCNAEDINSSTVHFCVMNNPPAFSDVAPATNLIYYGDTFTFDFNATDPDPGPYQIFSVVAPSLGTIDADGVYTLATGGPGDPMGGPISVTVKVSDEAPVCSPCSPNNSAEYTFVVNVILVELEIAKEEEVYIGQPHDVSITFSNESFFIPEIGGFDFLIQYDAAAMMFTSATEGAFLTECKWEYFTYRFGASGNCGGACPSGVVRVVAMGETNGGNVADHPDCWQPVANSELVVLHFLVSSDANLECQYAPIRFLWYDCADNSVSSKLGDILYVSQHVWDYTGVEPGMEVTGMDQEFPTLTGVVNLAGDLILDCELSLVRKGQPVALIHFKNGGLDIICADLIDAPGDINMNAIGYEIADAVMFTNYFIVGLTAFGPTPENHQFGSIAASDTNKDGITLSVADLVYLIRVVVGDALPYDKVTPVAAAVTYGDGVFNVDAAMGAAFIVMSGDVTPTLLAGNMEIKSAFDGENTRILVYSLEANSFSGDFLRVGGSVISTEFASAIGQPVVAKLMPTEFTMHQNYPNPFNPTTTIKIDVPKNGANWTLNIYNVNGQLVQTMSDNQAGFQEVVWDASNLASGVYFYKLTAGDYSATKKAVFLK